MALDLVFLIALAAVGAGLGLAILRRFGEVPGHPGDGLALALPLGLGAIALGVLGLGECGWMNAGGMIGLLVAAVCVALALGLTPHPTLSLKGGGEKSRHPMQETPPPLKGTVGRGVDWPGTWYLAPRWSWVWDVALALVLLGTLLTSLAPVTDGDALCYHLQVPKVFLASGSVAFDPDLHETVYPLLTEMLYAMALALRGPVACRLVQWLFGVVFALNVAALARPVLGERARWAATIALLVPAVSNGMGAPLNDVALAAFGNAALFAWMRWLDRPSLGAAALTGMLAGLAMGVKYPALVLTALIGLAMIVVSALQTTPPLRGRVGWGVLRFVRAFQPPTLPSPSRGEGKDSHAGRHVLLFGLVALMVGGVWYARTYLATGNPVYPFFCHVFGGAGLDVVLDPIKRPMPTSLVNLLTAIVPMTLQPNRFDSLSHQFGPLFLLVLPALFLERAPRRVWAIVAIGYAFLTLCLTQRQSMRFVLIAAGPMAVGVAWVAARWWDRKTLPARALSILLVACLAFEASIAAGRARHGLNVVLGRESASDYLTRREPTYRVGRWIDANLPADARLIGQDHRGFYIPRGYAMELAHRRRTGLGTHGESPEAIVATLRAEGFTHLLLCPPEPEDAVEFDPTLGRLLGPWLDRQPSLYRERIVDPDGVARRYAIYQLDEPDRLLSIRMSSGPRAVSRVPLVALATSVRAGGALVARATSGTQKKAPNPFRTGLAEARR